MKIIIEYSPYILMEKLAVRRFQKYLDTGIHDSNIYSKTWDMLAWLKETNEKEKN